MLGCDDAIMFHRADIFYSTATNIIAFVQLFRHIYFFWRSVGFHAAFLKV